MLKQSVKTWIAPLCAWLLFFLIIKSALATRFEHPCRRICTKDGSPMVCEYDFEVDQWSTMTEDCKNCPQNSSDCFAPSCVPADGQKKEILVVNKQLPGPLIEVCKGDRLIINVKNNLSQSTAVHWHGIEQRSTPYMDGVPYITQCPIVPSQTYVYNFTVEYEGTYFWHSHYDEQRADGFLGGLIVREYDDKYNVCEHVIILNEWSRISSQELDEYDIKGLRPPTPYNILINGLGRFPPNVTNMTLSTFEVESGKTHRFRVINSGTQFCPMSLAIENHSLTLISIDSRDIVPIPVESIRLLPGERYDFLLEANQTSGNYWIQVKGVDGESGCKVNEVFQMAILRYKGASKVDPPGNASYSMFEAKDSKQVNPFNKGIEDPYCIVNLNSTWPDSQSNTYEPDYQFFASYDRGLDSELSNATVNAGLQFVAPNNDNGRTFWRFNSISFKYPSVPLLTQYNMVDSDLFCDSVTVNESQCVTKFCECTHILPVKLYSIIELVLIDEGFVPANHPIHLHGLWFRVVSMGLFDGNASVALFKEMDEEGKIVRKLEHAVYKDTVMVPYNGYTVVRFYADNPGVWLLHCHFESHARSGLDLVFKIGDVKDFPVAPASIPRC